MELVRTCEGLSKQEIAEVCHRNPHIEGLLNSAQQRIAVALWTFTPHSTYEQVHAREEDFMTWMLNGSRKRFGEIQSAIEDFRAERSLYVQNLLRKLPVR